MKELEKMYDIIFENKRLQDLFLYFNSNVWDKIGVKDKLAVIEEINDIISNIYGYEKTKIRLDKDSHHYGSQSNYNWEIRINEKSLANDNGYEIIDTYFHELRHAFQGRAVAGKLTPLEEVDPLHLSEWKINQLPGNYIGGESPYYVYQSVEKDAWIHGMLFAKKIYNLNKRMFIASDPKWEEYCCLHRNIILNLISDSNKSKKLVNEKKVAIEEIFKENLKDIEQYRKGKKIVDNLKNIDNASFYEIGILMSKYCFSYLDNESKVKVLKKYFDFIKVNDKKLNIKEDTIGSIIIGQKKLSNDSSLSIVNTILSYNFQEIVEAIVEDKKVPFKLNDKARQEIKLNMYKDANGNRINFVRDSDNLFLFSLQPYAKYETHYVLKEFKKLKDIEYRYFKKNHREWAYWDSFYDNKLIFDTASKFFDIKFEDYYKKQLQRYKEKIDKSILKSAKQRSN